MKEIIIFGMGPPGLFLARELGNKSILHCIGRNDDIGMSSKYGNKYIAATAEEVSSIVRSIIKEAETKPIGLIASGKYLSIILEEVPEIINSLDMLGVDFELVKLLNKKDSAYKMLEKSNIKTPKSVLLRDICIEQPNKFPLIAKWAKTHLHHDDSWKTKIINDKTELCEFIQATDIEEFGDYILIQEYINGQNVEEWGYGAYFENGREVAGIVFEQKRQFPEGICCYATEVMNSKAEHISEELRTFLFNINYTGFIQFDILVDDIGNFYVLDVNPRPWGSAKILKKNFTNIGNYLVGKEARAEKMERAERPARFIRIFSDLYYIGRKFLGTRRSGIVREAINDYSGGIRIIDEFDKKDLGPVYGALKKGVSQLREL